MRSQLWQHLAYDSSNTSRFKYDVCLPILETPLHPVIHVFFIHIDDLNIVIFSSQLQTILVCRLLPFVPFDPVSYAAGLTSLRFWPFMLATGVGQLPATIVYSWAGSLLTGGTFWLATGLSLLFALAVVISIAKNIYRERHKRSSP